MKKANVVLIAALHLPTAAAAVGWAYASHKYDCFNIGPCVGDVDYWIQLGDVAFATFLSAWAALLFSTVFISTQGGRVLAIASAWATAIVIPPVVAFSASWLFNLGIRVSS